MLALLLNTSMSCNVESNVGIPLGSRSRGSVDYFRHIALDSNGIDSRFEINIHVNQSVIWNMSLLFPPNTMFMKRTSRYMSYFFNNFTFMFLRYSGPIHICLFGFLNFVQCFLCNGILFSFKIHHRNINNEYIP